MSRAVRWRTTAIWSLAAAAIFLIWRLTRDDRDLPDALWRTYYASTVAANIVASAAVLGAAWICADLARWRRRTAEVALAGTMLALTVGALEVPALAFGVDYGITFGTHANDTWLQLAQGVNLRDDELIHIHRPHTRYRGAVAGNLTWMGLPARPPHPVDVQYDRHGFRNREDADRVELAVIGDSFVEGAEVAFDDLATTAIARQLGVAVANLGQSNYGPQQELAVLRRFALPMRPRTVVWFFFGGNDLADVDAYEWRRTHLDEFLAPPTSDRSFVRNALVALARLTTPPRRTESAAAARHAFDYRTRSGQVERMYLDAVEGPWEAHQWDVATSVLREAREMTRRAGTDFIVAYIPRKFRVYDGFIESGPESVARTWQSNDLPQVLGDWCRAHDIAFLDLTASLRAAVAGGESVYLADDVHWNAAGHAVVGRAVADTIRTRMAVPPAGAAR